MTGRQKTYFSVRGVALVAFIASGTVMRPGIVAGVVAILAGIAGVLTCIGVNAGGPGERAGARMQAQQLRPTRAPQGDWPPYDEKRVVEGEVLR